MRLIATLSPTNRWETKSECAKQFTPKTGTVRLLRLTEKQYQNIYMVFGEADYQEKTVGSNCHIML